MVNYLHSCTGITSLEWLEVKTFSLFTAIMSTIDGDRIELLLRQLSVLQKSRLKVNEEISELWRQFGECKVHCVVTSVYTTHVTHAEVSVCFYVRWISLILSGGSEAWFCCNCVNVWQPDLLDPLLIHCKDKGPVV